MGLFQLRRLIFNHQQNPLGMLFHKLVYLHMRYCSSKKVTVSLNYLVTLFPSFYACGYILYYISVETPPVKETLISYLIGKILSLLKEVNTESLQSESPNKFTPSLFGPGLKAVPGGDNYRSVFPNII